MRSKTRQCNWYVITGGPSSGKTTIINELAKLGYATVAEAARSAIERELARGKNINLLNKEQRQLQKIILDMKIRAEKKTSKKKPVFFDRAVPDSIVYYRLHNLNPKLPIKLSKHRPYKRVFLFDLLPYKRNGVRVENAKAAKKIDTMLETIYRTLGYDTIRVPVMPIKKRLRFILKHIQNKNN